MSGTVYDVPVISIDYYTFPASRYENLGASEKAMVDAFVANGLRLSTYDYDSNAGDYIAAKVAGVKFAVYLHNNFIRSILYSSVSTPFITGQVYRHTTPNIEARGWRFDYYNNAVYSDYNRDINLNILDYFDSLEDAQRALGLGGYPITYRLTNAYATTAPTSANIGDIVTVPLEFPDGYGIVNSNDVYVTNNGVIVQSSYSDGRLVFTMPDPN